MGTWGVGIFSDDLAADLRGEYRDLLADGFSGPEATQRILVTYAGELANAETAPRVWLALAIAQSRVGRLEDRVRDQALQIIDGGDDLRRWSDDERLMRKRRTVLLKLRSELVGPRRPPVRIRPRRYSEWPFEDGMLLAYRRTEDRVVLFHVVHSFGDQGGRYGVVEPLDWTGSEPPPEKDLKRLPPRAPIDWTARDPKWIGLIAVGGVGLDRFTGLANYPRQVRPRSSTMVTIGQLDELLARRFAL